MIGREEALDLGLHFPVTVAFFLFLFLCPSLFLWLTTVFSLAFTCIFLHLLYIVFFSELPHQYLDLITGVTERWLELCPTAPFHRHFFVRVNVRQLVAAQNPTPSLNITLSQPLMNTIPHSF